MQEFKVLEGAEEFAFGDGRTAALLVHGFTGSPQSLKPVGEYLGARGISVVGIRLPGHGTAWEDLNARASQEWVDAVDGALDKLLVEHDEVFLVGLSFGGALALECAARRPSDVAGVVTLAGIVYTNDPRRFLAPAIRFLVKSLLGVGNDICDPNSKEICYDRLPTTAAYSMLRYLRTARASLPRVTCPVLVMHGRKDHTVHPSNAPIIMENISSADKELIWLERSYHVITLDYDRDQVYEKTFEFIKQRARSGL